MRSLPCTRTEGLFAAGAALLVFGYTWFGLRWLLHGDVPYWTPAANHIVLLVRLAVSLVAGIAAVALLRAVRRAGGVGAWLGARGWPIAVFAALAAAGCALLWVMAPGVIDEDVFYAVHMARSGAMDDWYSYLHPLLVQAVVMSLPQLSSGLALATVLGTAAMLAAWHDTAVRHGAPRAFALLLLCLCALSVPVWFNALRPTRDSWFTPLLLAWLLVAWRDLVHARTFAGWRAAAHVGAAVALTLYRTDALGAAAVVLAALALRTGPRRMPRAAFALAAFAVLLPVSGKALSSLLPALDPQVRSRQSEYMLTVVLNPLGHLLQQGYRPHDPATDTQVLAEVIDVPKAREVSLARNIPVFFQDYWRRDSTLPERVAFRNRALALFAENPALFAESRWRTFAIAAGVEGGKNAVVYRRDQVVGRWPWPVPATPRFPAAERGTWAFVDATLGFDGVAPRGKFLHWNLFPALGVCVLLLLAWPYAPATAVLSLALLARTALVILAAPASFFQYFLSLYIAGFLLPPLAWAEWRWRGGRAVTDMRAPVQARASHPTPAAMFTERA